MSEPGEITLEDSFDEEMNDDEMNDETIPDDVIEPSKTHLLVSPVQNLVEMAAYRIDLEPSKVKFLLHIMKEELITETWQLQYMDSANWRDMGFPIGLVASIRRLMHENDMTESGQKHSNNEYGFNGYPGDGMEIHRFPGILLNSSNKRVPEDAVDDESAATEPETPLMSPELPQEVPQELPQEEAELARERSNGENSNMKRISDITISERLRNRLVISPYGPKNKFGSSNNNSQAIKPSTKDQPPVSAPRRSSKKGLQAGIHTPTRSPVKSPTRSSRLPHHHKAENQATCSRTSMPMRPLRRPTLHDTPNIMFDIDDLSDAETFAMESVAMRLVGSKECEEKVDHNASMAVVTGSFGDMRELLVEGADSTIDEVG